MKYFISSSPLLIALIFGIMLPSEGSAGQIPNECFALTRTANGLKMIAPSNYDSLKGIMKRDIVCIGQQITFTEPVYTNGGNFIVFADKVVFRGQVDTRVYRPTFKWSENPPPVLNGTSDQLNEISRHSAYLQSYNQYYELCFDCRTELGMLLLPRLPDGLVPNDASSAGHNPPRKAGGAAPTEIVSSDSFYPGAITILARDLIVDPNLTGTRPLATSCNIAFPDKPKRFAFDASGVYGGRGGAGVPSACVGRYGGSGGWVCGDDNYLETGLSGPGSGGGDGGNIYVGIVADDVSEGKLVSIRESADVSGGLTVTSNAYFAPQTPDFPRTINVPFPATGSMCDFFRAERMQAERPKPLSGKPGLLDVRRMPRDEALRMFIELAVKQDAVPGYDYTSAFDDRNRFRNGILFSDHITAQLNSILRSAQFQMAQTIENLIYADKLDRKTYLPPILLNLDEKRMESARANGRLLVLLLELSKYGGPKSNSLERFFASNGGALNVAIPNPYQQYLADAVRVDAATMSADMADVKRQLAEIDRSTMEQLFLSQRQDLDVTVAQLQVQINAAIDEAKKQGGNPLSPQILEALGQLGSSVIGFYGAATSGNVPGAIASIGGISSATDKLIHLTSGVSADGPLAELRRRLEVARASLQRLFVELSVQRSRVSTLLSAAISGQIQGRLTLESRKGSRAILFEDLLKSVIISYFSDPSRDPETFRLNMIGLQEWLSDDYPLREPYFRVRDITNKQCPSTAVARQVDLCVAIEPDQSVARTLNARLHYGGQDIELPLYVIAPTFRRFVVPTYGFDIVERPVSALANPRISTQVQ